MIPNSEFLERFLEESKSKPPLAGAVGYEQQLFRLPHELAALLRRRKELEAYQAANAALREEMNDQSGDTWHDGLLRDTDERAAQISELARTINRLLLASEVDYPNEDETRATLGSRVELALDNGSCFTADIVGYRAGHPDNLVDRHGELIDALSLESPISQVVIGREVGEQVCAIINAQEKFYTLVAIDQSSLAGMSSDEVPS